MKIVLPIETDGQDKVTRSSHSLWMLTVLIRNPVFSGYIVEIEKEKKTMSLRTGSIFIIHKRSAPKLHSLQ